MPPLRRLTHLDIQLEQSNQLIKMLQMMLTLRAPVLHCIEILAGVDRVDDFRRHLLQHVDAAWPALNLPNIRRGCFGRRVEFGVDDAGARHAEVDADHDIWLPDVAGHAPEWCWHGEIASFVA